MNWQQNRNNGMKIIIVKYPLYVHRSKRGIEKKKKKTSRENFKSLARRLLRESSRDRIEIKQKTMLKGMTDWRKMNNVRNFFQEFIQPVRSNNSLLNDSWVFTVSKCFIFERNGIKTFTFSFLIRFSPSSSLDKFSNMAKKNYLYRVREIDRTVPKVSSLSHSATDKISILNCNVYRKLIVNAKSQLIVEVVQLSR